MLKSAMIEALLSVVLTFSTPTNTNSNTKLRYIMGYVVFLN